MAWQLSSITKRPCSFAMAMIASMSAVWPNKWTGTMALVFGVIFRLTSAGSMLKVPGSTSAKTGVIPSSATTSTVATKVKEHVMTSSPGFSPKAIMAIWRASVPFAQPITCFTPR